MRRIWWWLIPLLLLTTALGARGLNVDPLWGDEVNSLLDAGVPVYGVRSPAQIWEGVANRNPWHAPGYFILLAQWAAFVGWTPPLLRALSLLAGLLGVAWTYRLGRDLLNPTAGVFAAALLGVSAFFVYYLHELRMYALFALLTPFNLWCYLRVMRVVGGRANAAHWAGLLLSTIAMLYTHYLAALPLAVIGAYHLLIAPRAWRARGWWAVVGVMLAAGALFLPWAQVLLVGLGRTAEGQSPSPASLSLWDVLVRVVVLFSNGFSPLLLAALVCALLTRTRGRREAWFFALGLLGLLLAVHAALDLVNDRGRTRYLMGLWPLLALVAGLGLSHLWSSARFQRAAAGLLLAVWAGLGVWHSFTPGFMAGMDSELFTFPLDDLQRALRAEAFEGDGVIGYLPDGQRRWVYDRTDDSADMYLAELPVSHTLVRTLNDSGAQREAFEEAMTRNAAPRLWLAAMPTAPAARLDELRGWLDAEYQYCRAVVDQPRLRLDLYARAPVCCQPDPGAPRMRFGGVALVDYTLPPAIVDDALWMTLVWGMGDGVPLHAYSAGLHVFNAAGEKVAQADYGLSPAPLTCRETTLDTSALPPGEYTLRVTVYAWQTGARLTGTVAATGETAELLPLGTFRVEPGENG
jgi:hypothetical protein